MKPQGSSRAGFSLVEVALALGVASFCMFPLIGLLSGGVSSCKTTTSETKAVNLMGQVLSDLRAAPAAAAASTQSPFYRFTLPAVASGSTLTSPPQTVYLAEDGAAASAVGVAPSAGAFPPFRVTLGFLTPAAATGSRATTVRILITWPAQADADPTVWPSKYSGSLESVVAIGSGLP